MRQTDGITEQFEEAGDAFDDASEHVRALRRGAVTLRATLETAEGVVSAREKEVAAAPIVQVAPEDGSAHNVETRLARVVNILAGDPHYVESRRVAEQARADLNANEIELERWRDRRAMASHRLEFAIAMATPERLITAQGRDADA